MKLERRLIDGLRGHHFLHGRHPLGHAAQRYRQGVHRLLIADLVLVVEHALDPPERRSTRERVRESDEQRQADRRQHPREERPSFPENAGHAEGAGEEQSPRTRQVVVRPAGGRCGLREHPPRKRQPYQRQRQPSPRPPAEEEADGDGGNEQEERMLHREHRAHRWEEWDQQERRESKGETRPPSLARRRREAVGHAQVWWWPLMYGIRAR